ncbi:16S rRNA (adenine(1518)-N(6)/adenine(1519)-N(6))-dimethyltransferase RsmA [Thermohalobacter berrensis]|uniref:Ribosomal RNA small subunit methyltransferase A n=1 Tax=Thermohalobacter berrensis TaxID=99594 RepID=A0A419T0C0_9FIRM|nr:16S rRNA (adenine(1518)-N(6)/adenine(1519)-N(6))-dimethyltransferase RsmA [Thermohalobacter berrensis]RKD30902.1 16S rRNA (adenine(1518)-N(6)/adenine(1519)-N(6))-dimethyltransferase [Thermohalobacter berrensis]
MDGKKLYSPKVTKEIVEKYSFKFSKSLGQNFLVDGNVIRKICDGANITKEDEVLEIGPGIGTLTQILAERAKKVVSVEIDKKLLPILDETLSGYENVEIVHGDVLEINLNTLIREKFKNKRIKVVANLPYYITTPIIMTLLEQKLPIDKIVVMIQKEVALRMQANPGSKDYGSLSIAVQYYSEPKIITNVSKNVFIPKPKVDSTVIMLDILDKPRVEVKDEKLMFNIVKAAFAKRRKTLTNALNSSPLGLSKKDIKEALASCDVDPKVRGENLTIEEYAQIANVIALKF